MIIIDDLIVKLASKVPEGQLYEGMTYSEAIIARAMDYTLRSGNAIDLMRIIRILSDVSTITNSINDRYADIISDVLISNLEPEQAFEIMTQITKRLSGGN